MPEDEKCAGCGALIGGCVCCEGCGHICPLDMGEPFCPICKPEPRDWAHGDRYQQEAL